MAQELKYYKLFHRTSALTSPEFIRVVEFGTGDEVYSKSEVDAVLAEKDAENRRLERALWLARAERYKMREFIAREEANRHDLMAWSQFMRKRTYNQWVDQLLRIAHLANKLHNKCRAKAEEYK